MGDRREHIASRVVDILIHTDIRYHRRPMKSMLDPRLPRERLEAQSSNAKWYSRTSSLVLANLPDAMLSRIPVRTARH